MFLFRIELFLRLHKTAFLSAFFVVLIGMSSLVAPASREVLGAVNSRVEGIDNSYLISVNLDKFFANYKIEKIEADDDYYYVLYTFKDLVIANDVWQEMVIEKTRKITKINLTEDLGLYLAEQLTEENESRITELRNLQNEAKLKGPEKRLKVTEYSGLIGKALNIAGDFTGYEPVVKIEIPSPIINVPTDTSETPVDNIAPAENIKAVYDEYMATHSEGATSTVEDATSTIIVIPADSPESESNINATSTVNF